MHDLTEPFLRLLAAAVVGTVIGINRDLYGKPTGVRLHSLVSIARPVRVTRHRNASFPGRQTVIRNLFAAQLIFSCREEGKQS